MDDIEKKAQEILSALGKRTHVSRNMFALYGSRALMRISLASLNVFLPIFFYTHYNNDLAAVVLIFATMYLLHILLTPIAARLLHYFGVKPMIAIGMLCAVLAVGSLYFAEEYLALSVVGFTIFSAIYRALYWVPYQVDLAHMLSRARRGAQLALLRNFSGVLLIIAPVIGGILIASNGFSTVFLYGVVIMCLALVPLMFTHNAYERFSWDYLDTFTHLFKSRNRPLLLAHAANGAQGVAILVFWPIYIFTLLEEQYTAVGIISSLTLIAVLLIRYVMGKMFDSWSAKRTLLIGVLFSASGWILKVFVNTPLQIFVADTYHQFGNTANRISFDAATYEQSADSGRYVDEYTAVKDMAQSLGRVIMLGVVWALAVAFGLKVAFILAAIITLFMIVLNEGVKLS